jgi:hypothetical protein
MIMRVRFVAVLMTTLCVALASTPAVASHVSVDFGPIFGPGSDGDDFGVNSVGDGTACTAGSSGPESCPLTLLNNASTGAILLGFPIDFGNGPVSSLYANENGIVSFTGPITTTSFASLASVGQPVIAPFFTDLISVTFVGTVFELTGNFGQIMYQRGSASAMLNADGNFEQVDEVPAFSALWYGPTNASGAEIFAQLVLYSHASSATGDFDVRFRYGLADTDQYNTGSGTSGIAGLLLGSNSLNITGPILATTDYFYSFRGGKLVGAVVPPTLTCPTAAAQVGTPYSSALGVSGGVSPYTYSISTGSLPPVLTLNTSTGAITGTPTTTGPFTFTGKVVDSPLDGSQTGSTPSCTITVSPAAVLLQLSVSPTKVNFGKVPRSSVLSKTVTLKNTGTGAVSIGKVSVTPGAGTDSDDFKAHSSCPSSLAVRKKCEITVVLLSDDLGSRSATLNIPNNAGTSPQTVSLSADVKKVQD